MTDNNEKVTIFVMGKKHSVPSSFTIMKAMEYAGHQFTRGAGCRGGFCGACATIYRTKGSYKLLGALACQKIVEDGMYIAQIPFTPSEKKTYRIDNLRPDASTFMEFYPEISRCLSCNTCTKACPQDIMVMDYVQAALRGDVEQVAQLSFDCLSCGLCAVRCPAEIVPYNIGQLARRIYSRHVVGPTNDVLEKAEQVAEGNFNDKIQKLKESDENFLKELYENREMVLD